MKQDARINIFYENDHNFIYVSYSHACIYVVKTQQDAKSPCFFFMATTLRALDFVVFLIFGSNSASSNLTQQYVKFKRKLFCGVSSCDDRCMLFVVGCAVHFFLREISTKICYLTDWLFWLNLPFVVVDIIGGWGDCAD